MTSPALGSIFLGISLIASALTAIKLLATGLHKRFPVFFAYFIFRVLNGIVPFVVDIRSPNYFDFWRISFLLGLLFYVFLVMELYRLVLEKYRGLQTVGRWAMYVSVVISVGISILTLLPKINPAVSPKAKMIRILLITERGLDTALALFIVLLLAILSRYPIRLSRNVRVNAVVYSAFFLGSTVGLMMRSYFGMRVDVVNLIIAAIGAASAFAWLILLSPAGEEVPATQGRMQPEQERRLLTQLELLNTTMLRVARQQPR